MLALVFCFGLVIRIWPSWSVVFSDPVKYSADDGIYHMRLVENMLLGGHFPFRIYFDPFTNFPHGTYIHFTPLFDWLLAVIIWLASLGKPTLEMINKIAPFYPAVMGACLAFPVYFLTKAIFKNRAAALLAAFLSVILSPFLYRSLLGITDHHVAEVLFSTLAMMFLVFALQSRRKTESGKFSIDYELKSERKFWIYALLAGFSLGLYFLAWTGAIMFLFLIFCFAVLYYLIEYFLGRKKNWILQMAMLIFAVAFLMISPFFGHPDLFQTYMYNIVHLLAFGLGFLTLAMLLLLDFWFEKKKISKKMMPIAAAGAVILMLAVLKIFFPALFDSLVSGAKEVNTGMVEYSKARELVSEMKPADYSGLVNNFQMIFIVAMMAICAAVYNFFRNNKAELLLLVCWAVFVSIMSGVLYLFGQIRFICYLSPVFAMLFAGFVVNMFEFGWKGVCKARGMQDLNLKKYIGYGCSAIIFIAMYFLVYPFPFNAGSNFPHSLPAVFQDMISSWKFSAADQNRYDVADWLKNHTPDTGLDYYSLYKEPGVDSKTGKVNAYQYPDSAYGILAVWDFGHMITYYAHRIPVANPFQEGIGRKNSDGSITPGYATFFLEENEAVATGYLDELKVKYVIADSSSANSDNVYQQMIKWQQDELDGYLAEDGQSIDMAKYYSSMVAKLALFDGRQTGFETFSDGKTETFKVDALSHFRLLYESAATDYTLKIDQNQEIKKYKIFEYVKGVVLRGKAFDGTKIEVSVDIETNQGRKFTYTNFVMAENGKFEIIVPYSTGSQEDSEIVASKCKIKIGNYEREIQISESDVLNGNTIQL